MTTAPDRRGYSRAAASPRQALAVDHVERVPAWISLLALFSIVFIRLPLLTVHSTASRLLIISLFAAGAAWTLSRRFPARIFGGAAALLAAYLLIAGIAMLRGASAGVYSGSLVTILEWLIVVAMALFVVGLCASAENTAALDRRLALIVYAPAVYVATNILLRQFRHHLPFALPQVTSLVAGGKDELAGKLGIQATRVVFPLALGVNNFGAIAAAGFGAAVVLAVRRRSSRRIPLLAAAVCLYGVLATDSRGPFLLAIAAVLLFVMLRRVRTSGIALILPVSPVIVLSVLGFLAGSSHAGILSRHNGDVVTANNRVFIWHTAIDFIKTLNGKLFVGYGANGQIASHVSDGYAYLFNGTPDPTAYTTHNIALQTVLDSGYIGLLVFVVLVIAAIRALEKAVRNAVHSAAAPVLALLLVIVLSGFTEALPSYIFLDTFVLFVITVAAAVGCAPLRERIADAESPPPAPYAASPGRRVVA